MKMLKIFSSAYFLLILLNIIYYVKCASIDARDLEVNVCKTAACKKIAADVLEKMNQTVDPCDDFYEFVCGNYSTNAVIPPDKSLMNLIIFLRTKLKQELKDTIENDITENDPRSFKVLKSYYDSCMNEDEIEANSERDFLEILKSLGGWPVLTGDSWAESDFDWKKLIKKFYQTGYGTNQFLTLNIYPDLKNISSKSVYIDQPTLGISRGFLLKGFNHKVVQAYYNYMVDLSEIFGANRTKAEQELKESLNFEIELANISVSAGYRRNPSILYNPMTVKDLETRYPYVLWHEYINNLLNPYETMSPSETVIVPIPSFLEKLENLLDKTPKRVLANYAFWRIVKQSVPGLSERVRKAQLKFNAAQTGNIDNKFRWEECLDHVKDRLHLAAGALYVRKRFYEKSKKYALDMISDLKDSFYKMLISVPWMQVDTKMRAIDKLKEILPLIAFPDELLNDTLLDEYHKNYTIYPNSFLKTILSDKLLEKKDFIESLRKPVLRVDWTALFGNAAEVNAFYSPVTNSIQFPAGILQDAFFDAEHPNYMNYAGIGSVVGHEMTHGFDDQGRQFDKNGNLVDWWDKNTTDEYLKKAECMINQYSNYVIKEVNMNLDGLHSLGENIADNGGLKEAYYAYEEYQDKHGEEPRLPGLEKFNPKQMFWISNAAIWCTKYRPELLASDIVTDAHSPAKFRVIGTTSNMPEFSKDFNCPLGSPMNPIKKCAIW